MSAWTGLKNDRRITELPHYAINKSVPEDSFYTNKGTAKHCYDTFLQIAGKHKLNLDDYTFIEPSASDGCFFDLLPKNRRIGLDIQSSRNDIIKADFLQWYPSGGNYIVIGNPPFGHRDAYALAFINRAFLFAELVAFILPMSFYSNGKGTNMKRVRNARLIHSEKLGHESFRQPGNGEPVSVKTVFQVWQKGAGTTFFPDYDVSEFVNIYTVCSAPAHRYGMDKLNVYDCYIASTLYRDIHIVKTFDQVNYDWIRNHYKTQKKRSAQSIGKRRLVEILLRRYQPLQTYTHALHPAMPWRIGFWKDIERTETFIMKENAYSIFQGLLEKKPSIYEQIWKGKPFEKLSISLLRKKEI